MKGSVGRRGKIPFALEAKKLQAGGWEKPAMGFFRDGLVYRTAKIGTRGRRQTTDVIAELSSVLKKLTRMGVNAEALREFIKKEKVKFGGKPINFEEFFEEMQRQGKVMGLMAEPTAEEKEELRGHLKQMLFWVNRRTEVAPIRKKTIEEEISARRRQAEEKKVPVRRVAEGVSGLQRKERPASIPELIKNRGRHIAYGKIIELLKEIEGRGRRYSLEPYQQAQEIAAVKVARRIYREKERVPFSDERELEKSQRHRFNMMVVETMRKQGMK